MMREIDTIHELSLQLCENSSEFKTVGELVMHLVELGCTDKVYVRHDDHLGLEQALSSEFMEVPIDRADASEFEEEAHRVLDQANIILPLLGRELSEEDMEEIREDRERLGLYD